MEQSGRYRVVRVLGRGGMAEVLEAVSQGDQGFRRRVVIKRIRPGFETDESFTRMFLDEARIASELHHANIVGVLDYGIADGLPFQVLELVDGLDAGKLARRGRELGRPMPPEVALLLCTEVAHALAHAHNAKDTFGRPLGIVHRDVSPPNILVSWEGDVKLADFGIAFAHNRAEETTAGVTKGKLLYMAPEQAVAGQIDGRTDVFALGCVLQALLTGSSPLAGDNTVARLVSGHELEPSQDLPEELRALVAKATRRSKEDRYSSAAEAAEAFGRVLARRLDRDGRSLLREWLAPLKPNAEPRPSLDPLFDMELLLASASGPQVALDAGRLVTVISPAPQAPEEPSGGPADGAPTAVGTPRAARAKAAPEGLPEAAAARDDGEPRRAKRRPLGLVLGVAALLATSVGLTAMRLVQPRPASAPPSLAPPPPSPPAPAAPPPASTLSPPSLEAPAPAPAPAEAPLARAEEPVRRGARSAPSPPPPRSTPPPPPATPPAAPTPPPSPGLVPMARLLVGVSDPAMSGVRWRIDDQERVGPGPVMVTFGRHRVRWTWEGQSYEEALDLDPENPTSRRPRFQLFHR